MANNTDITLANDNGTASHPQLEDRTGFYSLLKKLRTELSANTAQESSDQSQADQDNQDVVEAQSSAPKYNIQSIVKYISYALLCVLAALCAWLLTASTDPLAHVTAYGGLFISGLAAASLLQAAQRWRVKALSILLALISGVAALYTLGASFEVSWLGLTENGFWFTASLLALWVSYAFRSRVALYASLAITAIWAYMLLSGSIALSASLILMPLAVGLQSLVARLNQDKFVARLTAIMMVGWAIALCVYAQITGFVTLPFLMSMLLMVAGITYTATAHPIKVWFKDRSRTTGLIAWGALMIGAIATCWMWLYATFDVSDPPSALNKFIWQLALIAGIGVLFASIFMRPHKTAHKLSRRILTAMAITALAISHYFQHEIMVFIQAREIESLPYFAAIAMLGALATLTLSRFLSSMTYEHKTGMIVSLFIVFAIGTCMSILVRMSQGALGVFLVAALLTLWVLAMTQNNMRPIKTEKLRRPRQDVIKSSEKDSELLPAPAKELSALKEA